MKTGLTITGILAVVGMVALSNPVADKQKISADIETSNILTTELVAAQHRDYSIKRN